MRTPCGATAALLLAGCGGGDEPAPAAVWFAEEAVERGLAFSHDAGARGDLYMPEVVTGGAALLDADGDGDLDAYLVQSGAVDDPPEARPPNRLFLNDGAGRFTDVTDESGTGDRGLGMGAACGDVDGDGDTDLFVTNWGPNTLLSNDGAARFEDTSAASGTGHAGWGTSATFFDADLDGALDLWVCNYINWVPAAEHSCSNRTGTADYCNPKNYQAPAVDTFYRGDGRGVFFDATVSSGVDAVAGTGLGVVCADFDEDGWLDVFVANDGMPDRLWRNRGGGIFEEIGQVAGCAVDHDGAVKAGMGVAADDVDGDGDTDLLVCNLDRESDSFFENLGGRFADRTASAGLRAVSRSFTRFGVGFHDLDLDGRLDLYQANGRVMRLMPRYADDPYAEPNLVMRGTETGGFQEVLPRGGTVEPLIATSRAAAFGDVDGDGAVDVLVANRDGPAHLMMNRAPRGGRWIGFRALNAAGSDVLNTRITLELDGRRVTREVRAGYSYQASNTPVVYFALLDAGRVDHVEVRWPDGQVEVHGPFEAERVVSIRRDGEPRAETRSMARLELEAVARGLRTGNNTYFGRAQIDPLRARVAAPGPDPREHVRDSILLTSELLRLGEIDEAIATVEAARDRVEADPALDGLLPAVHQARGLAHLRAAELANCVARHQADCCILPLRGGGVHTVQEPVREAFASYLVCAQTRPDDLGIRWLLNITSMALGEWPEGVPEAHRMPAETFASEANAPRFVDVAAAAGLDRVDLCGGTAIEDLDGDGLLDIVTTTWHPESPIRVSLNSGDGSFEDVTRAAGVEDQLGGLNCIGADHDGDGDVDLLVLRGAWLREEGAIRNSLLRNDGAAVFEDVTRAAGLALPARPTQAAVFGDLDNDGDLDLYIGNESRRETMPGSGDHPSQLFLNDGAGSFSDGAPAAGVTNDRYAKGVAAGDFDNDGDLDIYVSNVGANRLYRNDGAAAFEDVAPELGLTEPGGRSFATWFFDRDNDGWLDLFVGGYDAALEDVVASLLGEPHEAVTPRLYQNEGGTFRDVTAEAGLARAWLPMGANFGDVNGDGWLDVYLATGEPDYQTLVPNALLINDGGRRFLDATTSAGLGHLQKGHGVAFADLDHDGDQDLMHQLGGFYPGDAFANALFENPGHGNRWLVVELVGTKSNRAGFGARISVTVETPAGPRELHRAAGSVSSFGGSPMRQEIGLGDATRIAELTVRWPASGLTQRIEVDVPLDAHVRVTEGRGLEVLDRPPLSLGGD